MFSFYDSVKLGNADIKFIGEYLSSIYACGSSKTSRISSPNVCHLFGRKFCAAIVFSMTFCLPSFHVSISDVVSVGAQPEMIRSDAIANIATVADSKPFWDRSSMQFPRKAMNQHPFSVYHHSSIAICFVTSPQPASAGLSDLIPEVLHRRTIGVCNEEL